MIGWLIQKFRDRHDPELQLQRPVVKYEGYDRLTQEAAIKAAHVRHQQQFAQVKKVKAKTPKVTVVAFRKDKQA